MLTTRTTSTLIVAMMFASACGSSGTGTSPTPVVVVTSIAPSVGSTLGGTKVTITGSNFSAGASVLIGGAAATDVSVASATSITATTPAHAAGTADVVVTAGGHSGTLPGAFSFIASAAPVINSIVVQGSVGPREPAQFASLGETVQVTAAVTDSDTPVSQLTFQWSDDSGGTFTGTGASVSWTAPRTLTLTPATATLSLTVKDAVNTVTATRQVRVHDSVREVNDLAVDFLTGFSEQRDPAYVVRNFSDSCTGKASEQADVQKNNDQNKINSYTIGTPSTTIVFTGAGGCPFRGVFGDACAQVPVEWHATSKSTGIAGVAKGTDQVTAILENDQWRLCASDFNGVASSTLRFLLRQSR